MKKYVELVNGLDIITNIDIINDIDNILNDYLCKIDELQYNIGLEDIIGAAYVYAEIYEYIIDKERWNNIIKTQFIRLKEYMEQEELVNGIALFGGVSEIGLAIYLYSKKTGQYINFWMQINEIILDNIIKLVEEYNKRVNNLQICYYDCISGLSGILNYLIEVSEEIDANKFIIEEVLGYLIKVTENKQIKGKIVPGWHIRRENQIREEEKLKFENGNFDFGLSHGIAGPLAAMSLAYQKGYRVKGQKEAIIYIVEEYIKLATRTKDCTLWQGQYSFESYLDSNQNCSVQPNRMSWCYGPIGILRALKLAGIALDSQKLIGRVQNNIYQIAAMTSKDYLLMSPIICHGYAGLMTFLVIEYKEQENYILKDKINELTKIIIEKYNSNFKFGFMHTETYYQNGALLKNELFGNDFLYGASGIILSLISLLKEHTCWEIHLLAK